MQYFSQYCSWVRRLGCDFGHSGQAHLPAMSANFFGVGACLMKAAENEISLAPHGAGAAMVKGKHDYVVLSENYVYAIPGR
jgi:hypothetical protein